MSEVRDTTELVRGSELRRDPWQCRVHEQRAARAAAPMRLPLMTTDADKYRWIRANRGNFAIFDALNKSDRDADFDEQIESAMRMSAAGRHCVVSLDDLAN